MHRSLAVTTAWYLLALLLVPPAVSAQQVQLPQQQNTVTGVGFGTSGTAVGSTQNGSSGGGANADFDSLIDLIESTVAVETWAESGGGEAEIRPFPNGVFVEADDALREFKAVTAARAHAATSAARIAQRAADHTDADPRRAAAIRYISLPRLEREIIRRQDAHLPLDPAMLTLAGLQRVMQVVVIDKTETEPGDLLLVGPAGDWQVDPVGRIVSVEAGAPGVRLDDLLTLLRRAQQSPSSYFGCSINPRTAALAATQAFLDRSAARPLEPGTRQAWVKKIRDTLGQQDVEIFGIDPASRVARVLVEADVHMKLVGMGIEPGVPGVVSYLDSIKQADQQARRAGGQPPAVVPMAVLRWWFALQSGALRIAADRSVYELAGERVCVLSENELLEKQGHRVHTGQSDPLNEQFATSFTSEFASLARKYPVYAELRTIFDLALVAALIDADQLADRAGWQPSRLLDADKLRLPRWPVPRAVDTVANSVVVNRRQIVAGVSGGVMVDARSALAKQAETAPDRIAAVARAHRVPPGESATDESATDVGKPVRWWWDGE